MPARRPLPEAAVIRRAGFTAAHDRLPEFMLREKLSPTDSVFDVPQTDLDRFYDFEL
jgi:aldehyde:ferredoxin oxidoreductase